MFTRFLLFAFLCSMSFAYSLFGVPVYLSFQNGLFNCDLHQTQSGCLSSTKAGCLWIAENETDSSSPFTCKFPDYKTVDCSRFNNDSTLCLEECEFRFAANKCVHTAGFSGIRTGIFSASTVAGGLIGPFFAAEFAKRFNYASVFFIFGAISFLSAALFTAGIESGDFGLWVSSKIFSSFVGMTAPGLLAPVMRKEASAALSPETQHLLNQIMGASINFGSLFIAIFLYVDMPRGDFAVDPQFKLMLQNFNVVQWLFSVGWILFGFGLVYPEFFDNKICCCLSIPDSTDDKKEDELEDEKQQTTKKLAEPDQSTASIIMESYKHDQEMMPTSTLSPATSTASATPASSVSNTSIVNKSFASSTTSPAVQQKDDNDNDNKIIKHNPLSKMFPGAPIVEDDGVNDNENSPTQDGSPQQVETNDTNNTNNDEQRLQQQQEENETPKIIIQEEKSEDTFWFQILTAVLVIFVQQFSSIDALNAFLPLIVETVFTDPFLGSICFSGGLVVGSLLAVFVFGKYFLPRNIYIGSSVVCAIGAFLIGLSLHPAIELSDNVAGGISLFAIILFGVSFGIGLSSQVFALLAIIFTDETISSGMSVSLFVTVLIQVLLRLLFPLFIQSVSQDPRESRGIAFFGFTGIQLIGLFFLVICLRILFKSRG